MKEIMFRIENRHLLKLGWQQCIAGALEALGVTPAMVPDDALLLHRPVPNKAQTVFHIFTLPEGQAVPVVQTGKIRNFYEYMAHERNNFNNTDVQPESDAQKAARQREELLTRLQAESDSGGRPLSDSSGVCLHGPGPGLIITH